MATLLTNFIARWINRYADWDGVYGAQCFDLIQFWSAELQGGWIPATGTWTYASASTFTVPVPALKTATTAHVVFGKDNGSNLTTPSHLSTTAASQTITAYKSFAAAPWTNVNAKDIYIGLFSYAF